MYVATGRDIANLGSRTSTAWAFGNLRERRVARLAPAHAFFGALAPAVRLVRVASPVSARMSPSLICPLATRLFTSTFTLPANVAHLDIDTSAHSGTGDRRAKRLGMLC